MNDEIKKRFVLKFKITNDGKEVFQVYDRETKKIDKEQFTNQDGAIKKMYELNGIKTKIFYHFDCLNDLGNDNNMNYSDFKTQQEAIALASDYEADLYRIIVDEDGNKIDSKLLYEAWGMFD